MATITLGNIKFNWKGAWNSGTAYVIDDVVSLSGSSYVCIQAGTNQNPASASAYWEQMSSAGTNGADGTDLTTTLTTQGDLVYRDGSGLQRLGAGTTGQVLQTGGSGANPSWGTVSSDFVKLAEVNTSGNTYISIDGYFSSTYRSYKIITKNLRCGTEWQKFQLNRSGTRESGSVYRWAAKYHRRTSGANSEGIEGGWNVTYLPISWWGATNTSDAHIGEIDLINVGSGNSTEMKMVKFHSNSNDGGNTISWIGGGYLDIIANDVTGITFFGSTPTTYTRGTVALYGIK
jgi:hypothetical protein